MLIDRDLDEEQMDRLNSVRGVTIRATCAGHPESDSAPYLALKTHDGRVVEIESTITNTGNNAAELHAWWDRVIERLANEPETLLATSAKSDGSAAVRLYDCHVRIAAPPGSDGDDNSKETIH